MGVLGNFPPIGIRHHLALVFAANLRPGQALHVVADGEGQLVGGQALFHQIQGELVCHLPNHQAGFLPGIRAGQHLAGADGIGSGPIGLDIRNGAGLPAPGVVNQQLCVDAEEGIQKILVEKRRLLAQGAPGDVPHGVQAVLFQALGVAPAYPPEVRQGAVVPQELPVGHLVQLCNADPLPVRLHMLGHNVHSHLAQVQVGAHPGGGRDAGMVQHLTNQHFRKAPAVHIVDFQIGGGVDEYLVNGIDMDILRRHEFQIELVDLGADTHIPGHLGRGHNIVHLPIPVLLQKCGIPAFASEGAAGGLAPAQGIHLRHLLHHLKKPGPPRNAIGLQGGGHRQADGFLRPPGVCHHQIGAQRVQLPLHALH